MDYSCAYGEDDLATSLAILAKKLTAEQTVCHDPFTMLMSNFQHTINVSYLPPSKDKPGEWLFIDASSIVTYCSINDSAQLANMICHALNFDPVEKSCAIIQNQIITTTDSHDAVKSYLDSWMSDPKINAIHTATSAKNEMLDHGKISWLMMAAMLGHIKEVDDLINALKEKPNFSAKINQQDLQEDTSIMHAAFAGHLEVVAALIKAGADINLPSNKGDTPINMAAFKGHRDVVEALINAHADLNQAGNNGFTPINSAAILGHLEIVEDLIKAHANINQANNNGFTPINSAAHEGHQEVVKAFIKAGAALNQANDNGFTPINSAAYVGHLEAVKALIKAGADINLAAKVSGYTPINSAAFSGHLEIVKALIIAGADITLANKTGFTPIRSAIYAGHLDIVKALYEYSIANNIHIKMDDLISLAAKKGHPNIVSFLTEEKAKVHEAPHDSSTNIIDREIHQLHSKPTVLQENTARETAIQSDQSKNKPVVTERITADEKDIKRDTDIGPHPTSHQ
jgi:ankyrin repeat protein